jgi:thiosulfate/3-mercaptopyruvate sulfurtransferase
MLNNPYTSCEAVAKNLSNPGWVFVDCRYSLADKSQGRHDYLEAHLPGAVHADPKRDVATGAV